MSEILVLTFVIVEQSIILIVDSLTFYRKINKKARPSVKGKGSNTN